jgi:hypothetical protein
MQKNSKEMLSETLELMYDQKIYKRHENVPYNFSTENVKCFCYGKYPLIIKSPPLNPTH